MVGRLSVATAGLILGVMAVASESKAQDLNTGFMDVGTILKLCDDPGKVTQIACEYYIGGIIDSLGQVPGEQHTCFMKSAAGVGFPEMKKVAIDYMRAHQGDGFQGAAFQAWQGLIEAYPCKAGYLP
jgi:hypothetical protein